MGEVSHRSVPVTTGVSLHVAEREGEAPAILCLHGIWDDWRYFEPLLNSGVLDPRHVIMVDHRGHGESEHPTSGYRWDDYAADAVALVDALNLDRVILIGHSLGALTALLAAPDLENRLAALLLEDPPLPLRGGQAEVFTTLLELKHKPEHIVIDELRAWRPFLTEELAAESARRLQQTADGVLKEAVESIGSEQPVEIPRPGRPIPVPTLVIQAGREEERAFGQEGRELLGEVIENLTIKTVPDTSHTVLQDAPDAYARIVKEWLDGLVT